MVSHERASEKCEREREREREREKVKERERENVCVCVFTLFVYFVLIKKEMIEVLTGKHTLKETNKQT